jgi:3-hydroxybutyryl-CoA dehydratase
MQEYLIKDIKVGLKHSFEVNITELQMQYFLEISGDINPMHLDSSYAKSKGMKDKIVFGMLISSFYSTLVGVYIPGKYALLHSIDISFVKPVFIGDKLVVEGVVSSVHELFHQIEVNATIRNYKNEKISRAKIKIGVLND